MGRKRSDTAWARRGAAPRQPRDDNACIALVRCALGLFAREFLAPPEVEFVGVHRAGAQHLQESAFLGPGFLPIGHADDHHERLPMLGDDLRLAAGGSFRHGGEMLFGFLKLERFDVEKIRGICPVCPEKVPADRQLNRQYAQILNNRIMTQLRCGSAPETKPWISAHCGAHSPREHQANRSRPDEEAPRGCLPPRCRPGNRIRGGGAAGLAEIDRGERIPIEEIERELPSWVIR